MSEFSHLKNKLLAEQVEDEIYHYILDTPLEPGAKLPNEGHPQKADGGDQPDPPHDHRSHCPA